MHLSQPETSGRFPFSPFPTGWYLVATSAELETEAVFPVTYFGCDQVLFRTSEGEARLFEAFCPHFGAHLGHGGTVEGETIRCPFHGWSFGTSGACAAIPYTDNIPVGAQLRSWPIAEYGGMILAYHDEAEREPTWAPPPLPDHDPDEWTEWQWNSWQVRTHPQEICENGFDATHFDALHGFRETASTGHAVGTEFHSRTEIDARDERSTEADEDGRAHVDVVQHALGLAFTTTTVVEQGQPLEYFGLTCTTPLDGDDVLLRFAFRFRRLADPELTRRVAEFSLAGCIKAVEEDIAIWTHKRYVPNPILVESERSIRDFRRWARQFYPASDGQQ